jgi:NAD(P)-dependent dehydrogenase (short-subunit alcohol dehydrogenase family)
VKILVCNGALADDTKGFTKEVSDEMFKVNYHGCLKLNQIMLPLMSKGSRIVNVSSVRFVNFPL